jgi:hypothetical protein
MDYCRTPFVSILLTRAWNGRITLTPQVSPQQPGKKVDMPQDDITSSVERLQELEARLNVSINAVSAFLKRDDDVDDDASPYLEVRGELVPVSGSKLKGDIELIATAHDEQGRVVGKGSEFLDAEEFFGLESFEISIELPVSRISKVKLYPKKS